MKAQIEAVRRVVGRCRGANPSHMHVPASGATVMEWLLEELTAVAEVGESQCFRCAESVCDVCGPKIAAERERCARELDRLMMRAAAAAIRAMKDKT